MRDRTEVPSLQRSDTKQKVAPPLNAHQAVPACTCALSAFIGVYRRLNFASETFAAV